MNNAVKKVLIYFASVIVAVALIAAAPISRLVYGIYDANRTAEILKQLENESAGGEEQAASDFHKQAYVMRAQNTEGGKTVNSFDLLVLTSDSNYELSHYEQVVTDSASYTGEYFHMMGQYTREGNVVTVQPGIGVMSENPDNSGFTHTNAQYLTAEEAAGEKTRDEVYAMKYSSNQFALMQDGSFVMGGTSDASEELGAPAGRSVYTDAVLQGRVTFKTLVVFEDGTYVLYSQAVNSNNAEQTTGAFFGFGTYEIKDSDRGIAPDEAQPEQTYDIFTGAVGRGFMYANNNGSHMQFDLQTDGQFSQWLATSFNASSPTFYITESGCTIKIGALKTNVDHWGLYVPAADAGTEDEKPEQSEDIKLEVESSAEGKPFILNLNADGTLTTGWTNYEQTLKDGTWSVFGDSLILDLGDSGYTYTVEANADGTLTVTVNYGQMGDKAYTLSAEQAAKVKENAKPIALTVESSAEGKPFVLTINADGTLTTGWTNYEQTLKDGTWSVEGGVLNAQAESYTFVIVHNEDGSASITVNYGQMGDKEYILSAAQYDAIRSLSKDLELTVESSVEGKPFILTLREDGTLATGWTNYAQTVKEGTWVVENGKLVLDLGDSGYVYEITQNADGSVDITINYGQMGDKTYTLTPEQAAKLIPSAGDSITLEIESSVEGKPFVLNINADGTLTTGWTNYEQTVKSGTWSVENGSLVLDLTEAGYTAEVVVNADGSADITVNYGQMGDKVYTLSAAQMAALTGGAAPETSAPVDIALEIASSVEGKPFVLNINADGTVVTGWTNYEQTVKSGTWSVENGSLVLDLADAGYTAEVVVNADGSADITVNYGQMGDKVYTLSAAQMAALTGGAAPETSAPVDIALEIASSVEGKPFVLKINADGTLTTGWTNYEQTVKSGTWSVENGSLVLDLTEAGYTAEVVVNADGSADVTINYGQMGDKVYSVSADQFKAIVG